jgi:hypothetical protein
MPAPTKGFLDKVLTKEFAFRELTNAKGNPFVNLLTKLKGVTLLTIMTTPDAAYRWWFRDPVTKILFKGDVRQDRGEKSEVAQFRQRDQSNGRAAPGHAGRHRGALRKAFLTSVRSHL